jgi:hypothetical protein
MAVGPKDYLKVGDYNAECQRCHFKFKASELRREWTNLLVCDQCYDPRHPQEFLRAARDDMTVPFVSPELPPVFVED